MSEPGGLARECHCVLCEPPEDQGSWTGAQREFAAIVVDRGWTVLDLPRGWEAEYQPPDGAWERQECPPYYWLDQ